jgi:hypothetical protein
MHFELFGCGQPEILAAEVGLLAARAPTRPAARGDTRGHLGPFRGVRSIPSSAPPRVWPQTPPTARTACRPEAHQRSLVENGAQIYSTSGCTDKNRALGVLDGSLRPAHWKNAKLEVAPAPSSRFRCFPTPLRSCRPHPPRAAQRNSSGRWAGPKIFSGNRKFARRYCRSR